MKLLPFDLELNVAGAGQKIFEQKNIREAHQNGIRINALGHLQQSEVYEQYVSNHIFCTPARHEALGVANIEALVHKIPVVYTNVGGIPEIMDNGRNGFEAFSNDPKSLAMAIRKCITKPHRKKY